MNVRKPMSEEKAKRVLKILIIAIVIGVIIGIIGGILSNMLICFIGVIPVAIEILYFRAITAYVKRLENLTCKQCRKKLTYNSSVRYDILGHNTKTNTSNHSVYTLANLRIFCTCECGFENVITQKFKVSEAKGTTMSNITASSRSYDEVVRGYFDGQVLPLD